MTKANKTKSNKKFRFCGKFLILTYKHHIDDTLLIKHIRDKSGKDLKCKIVWETGKTEYNHTHIVIKFIEKFETRNCRKFDYKFGENWIHPNWKSIKTRTHFINIVGTRESIDDEGIEVYSEARPSGEGERDDDEDLGYFEKEDKAEVIYCDLYADDWPTGGLNDNWESLIQLIQSKRRWKHCINDINIAKQIHNKMKWAREIFNNKPKGYNAFTYEKLLDWQTECVERLMIQNDRQVLWIFDRKGNSGKSCLTDYLIDNYECFECCSYRGADIAYAYDKQPVVIFDIPRSKMEYTPYSSIEGFKDGKLFSPKYESCIKRFERPKVICFSNHLPKFSEMTLDRWDIGILEDGKISFCSYDEFQSSRLEESSSEDEESGECCSFL